LSPEGSIQCSKYSFKRKSTS